MLSVQPLTSPIQGSAADILKIAMINLDKALVEGKFKTKMLLQVHDEIILEVPKDELEAIEKLVKETMESAIERFSPTSGQMKVQAKHGTKQIKK